MHRWQSPNDDIIGFFERPDITGPVIRSDRILWWDPEEIPTEYRKLCKLSGAGGAATDKNDVVHPDPKWVTLGPEELAKQPERVDLNSRLTKNFFACLSYRFGYMLYHLERRLIEKFPAVRSGRYPVSAGQAVGPYKNTLIQYEVELLKERAAEYLSFDSENLLQDSESIILGLFEHRDSRAFNAAWPPSLRALWWEREAAEASQLLEDVEEERLLYLPVHQDPLRNDAILHTLTGMWKSHPDAHNLGSSSDFEKGVRQSSKAATTIRRQVIAQTSTPRESDTSSTKPKQESEAALVKEKLLLRKHILKQAQGWPSKEEDQSVTFSQMHESGEFFYPGGAEDWWVGDPVQMKEREEATQAGKQIFDTSSFSKTNHRLTSGSFPSN